MAGEVGGEDRGIVLTERDAEGKVVCGCDAADFAAVGIPEVEVVVAAACDETSIVAVVNAEDTRAVCVPTFELFAFLHFPKFDGAVFA